MNQFSVTVDGQRVKVKAEWVGAKLWMHFGGRTFCTEKVSKSRRSQSESLAKHVVAPMPGKILKVSTKSGASVKRGDVLVILEAMKMEYSLEAPRDGEVAEVLCQVGSQVSVDDVLVQMKEQD